MGTLKDTLNSIKRNKDSKHFVKIIDEWIIKFWDNIWVKPVEIARWLVHSKKITGADDLDICVETIYINLP